MINIKNAYENIVKDKDWKVKFCAFALLVILFFVFPASTYTSTTAPKGTESLFAASQFFSTATGAFISLIMSFIGGLFLGGYNSVYLRNLLADKNAPIPDIKSFFEEIFVSGLKIYLVTFCYYIIFFIAIVLIALILLILFIILGVSFSSIIGEQNIPLIVMPIAIITFIALGCTAALYCPCLLLNYSAKNLELKAWFEIKNASKFICKDLVYLLFLVFLYSIAVTITAVIIIAIGVVIGFLSGAKDSGMFFATPVMCFTIYPLSAFLMLMYINLLAQIYYSKIEKNR